MKTFSSVLSFLFGKLTFCSKRLSATMSKKVLLTLFGYWLPTISSAFLSMSGKLKSPPIRKIFFFLIFRHCERCIGHPFC